MYDDRRVTCGYCGATLPEALRRTPETEAAQAAVKAELEAARAAERVKAEAEARAREVLEQQIPNAGMNWINRP